MYDHRRVAVIVAAFVALTLVVVAPERAAAAQPSGGVAQQRYQPPVDALVTEAFALPEGPYGRGNRGVDYATEPGTPVRAASDGEVIFAGPVAGSLHVTVRHPDGLRTSYSFLATIDVRVGESVAMGQPLGTTGVRLHFGVRDGADTYLDPALLLGGELHPRARLVPGTEEGLVALQAEERRGFLALAAVAADVVLPGIAGQPNRWRVLAHYATELQPVVRMQHLVEGYERWYTSRDNCTRASVETPRVSGRRILVLVAGFGSTSAAAGVDKVDAATLGYGPGDVIRFSYRGGRVPSTGLTPALDAVASSDYGPDDSQQDLVVAADRLGQLLRDVATADPGVPIDVVAHSQGGVVSRLAVLRSDADGSLPDSLETLVTVSSPHGGADLATALNGMSHTSGADSSLAAIQGLLGLELDANSPAVAELSEVSPLTDDLRSRGVPDRVHFVSIGARGDPVVANPRTVVEGEASVVVNVSGIHAHDQVPGSSEVTREVALAVAGQPPTCSSFSDTTLDLAMGESISFATDALGADGLVLAAPLP